MLQILAVLLIFFLLFSFLVLTKCQVLNLMVGRSRDQVLPRAYCDHIIILPTTTKESEELRYFRNVVSRRNWAHKSLPRRETTEGKRRKKTVAFHNLVSTCTAIGVPRLETGQV